jgi:hypothetical protein
MKEGRVTRVDILVKTRIDRAIAYADTGLMALVTGAH